MCPINDTHANSISSLESPANHMSKLTISDTVEVGANIPRAIYVKGAIISNTTVTLKVTTLGGEVLVTPPLAVGVPHPLRVTKVWATDSDANCSVWGVW